MFSCSCAIFTTNLVPFMIEKISHVGIGFMLALCNISRIKTPRSIFNSRLCRTTHLWVTLSNFQYNYVDFFKTMLKCERQLSSRFFFWTFGVWWCSKNWAIVFWCLLIYDSCSKQYSFDVPNIFSLFLFWGRCFSFWSAGWSKIKPTRIPHLRICSSFFGAFLEGEEAMSLCYPQMLKHSYVWGQMSERRTHS